MKTDATRSHPAELPEAERDRSGKANAGKANGECRCLAALLEAEQEREKKREQQLKQAAWSRERTQCADFRRSCLRLSGW